MGVVVHRGRGYYVDPLQLTIECGSEPTRDKAVAALSAAADMVGGGIGSAIVVIAFAVVFSLVGLSAFGVFTAGGAAGLFALLPLFFVLFGIAIAATAIRELAKRRRAARALRELARMVEAGVVSPGDVCGLTVAAAVELYKMRAGSLPVEPTV